MQVEKSDTAIGGFFEIRSRVLADARGTFVKTFHRETFERLGLRTDWVEQYYSISLQGVLRGLHFQLPPHDHAKLVCCVEGEVLDVAVDLRTDSPTFGLHACIVLRASEGSMAYLDSGLAHGFYTLSDRATVAYSVTSAYAPSHDAGIRWNSAGIPWPHPNPLLSARDRGLPALAEFESPFRLGQRVHWAGR